MNCRKNNCNNNNNLYKSNIFYMTFINLQWLSLEKHYKKKVPTLQFISIQLTIMLLAYHNFKRSNYQVQYFDV